MSRGHGATPAGDFADSGAADGGGGDFEVSGAVELLPRALEYPYMTRFVIMY